MEVRRRWGQPVPRPVEGAPFLLGSRQVGQEREARVRLAQIACPEPVEGPRKSASPSRAARPNPLIPCAAPSEREAERTNGCK